MVYVDTFGIDACVISNVDFARFAHETDYVTETEAAGWSFVFGSLLPDDFPPTRGVAAAPWWRQVEGAAGGVRRARTRRSALLRADGPAPAGRTPATAHGCRPRRRVDQAIALSEMAASVRLSPTSSGTVEALAGEGFQVRGTLARVKRGSGFSLMSRRWRRRQLPTPESIMSSDSCTRLTTS